MITLDDQRKKFHFREVLFSRLPLHHKKIIRVNRTNLLNIEKYVCIWRTATLKFKIYWNYMYHFTNLQINEIQFIDLIWRKFARDISHMATLTATSYHNNKFSITDTDMWLRIWVSSDNMIASKSAKQVMFSEYTRNFFRLSVTSIKMIKFAFFKSL